MNHEPLDTFDQITRHLPCLSVWEALFTDTEELLRKERPEGCDVVDIGRAAWARLSELPEEVRTEALDTLLYTYWAAREADRETHHRLRMGD